MITRNLNNGPGNSAPGNFPVKISVKSQFSLIFRGYRLSPVPVDRRQISTGITHILHIQEPLMRGTLIAVCILLSLIGCAKKNKTSTEGAALPSVEYMYVKAQPHLNMREKPDANAAVTDKIPNGEQVVVLEKGTTFVKAGDTSGYWHRISWQKKEGWAFSAFLISIPLKAPGSDAKGEQPYDFGGNQVIDETLPGYESYPQTDDTRWVVTDIVAPALLKPAQYTREHAYGDNFIAENAQPPSSQDQWDFIEDNKKKLGIKGYLAFGEQIQGTQSEEGWVTFEHTITKYVDNKPVKENLTLVISTKHLQPEVKSTAFSSRRFYLRSNCSDVYLLPGRKRVRLNLFHGEALQVIAECTLQDTKWYKAVFSSMGEGVGTVRYGWIHEKFLFDLSTYTPDQSNIDSAMVPSHFPRDPYTLDASVKSGITRNGFVITQNTQKGYPNVYSGDFGSSGSCDEMIDSYLQYSDSTRFITIDLLLHATHLVFDRMLQKMEKTFLTDSLRNYCREGLKEAKKLEERDDFSKEVKKRAILLFAVPLSILDSGAQELKNIAFKQEIEKEVQSVKNASGAKSPITGMSCDYSMYTPRGHYTKSEELKNYFWAMNVFSVNNFSFMNAEKDENTLINVSVACFAANYTKKNPVMYKEWEIINRTISYLIGEMDDISVPEIVKSSGSYFTNLSDYSQKEKAAKYIKEQYKNLRAPLIIDMETGLNTAQKERENIAKGFRVFGPRFVMDAYIFQKLTYPHTSTEDAARNLPFPEDAMYVLGSPAAEKITRGEKVYLNYEKNINELSAEIKGYREKEWNERLYTQWLYSIKAIFDDQKSDQYFFKSDAWKYKQLESALGSWSELKHDTLLYSKQSFAEGGSGGDDMLYAADYAPPIPLGYVEPQAQVFERIATMCKNAQIIMSGCGFNNKEYGDKFKNLEAAAGFYQQIALKEIRGEVISDAEYLGIQRIDDYFNSHTILDQDDASHGVIDESDLQMALIADVATDALTRRVLHVAVGKPKQLYVFVNDRSAGPRVCLGYMFDYYSFASQEMKRYNDEEWKEMVYGAGVSGNMKPAWSRGYDGR